ncbi:MAG: ribonuclease HII [Saprospiraceae bacterium]|nr:ribonuclease HII [Saprospiraceae bacterium]
MLEAFFDPMAIEAGCDEAGRGCLAGPVVAAAVILPKNFQHPILNDSKILTESQRDELVPIIKRNSISWAVASLSPKEIDRHNILNASFLAMHKAIGKLKVRPGHLLIDGNRFIPYLDIPFQCIIKGDSKYASIAAASVLAKTHRDAYMKKLDTKFPQYQWSSNKGYPTQAHRKGIEAHGPSKHHRMSFRLLPPPPQGILFEK